MIDSSLVRKTEKAKDYAVQPDRVTINQFKAEFRGDNSLHEISYEAGKWNCTCRHFAGHDTCSHTMAMHIMLEDKVNEPVATP